MAPSWVGLVSKCPALKRFLLLRCKHGRWVLTGAHSRRIHTSAILVTLWSRFRVTRQDKGTLSVIILCFLISLSPCHGGSTYVSGTKSFLGPSDTELSDETRTLPNSVSRGRVLVPISLSSAALSEPSSSVTE